jgi:uncharacterized membrane protein YkvI
MKIIKTRDKVDKGILVATLILAVLPVIGLLSGVATSMGLYGMNYQEVALLDNPEDYWYIIKLELSVVFCGFIKATYCFPLFDAAYQRILLFKQDKTFIAYTLLYIAIPICVVAFCLFLISFF